MNELEWKSSLKETPLPGKIVVAWHEDCGLASGKRTKEGKWTLSHSDGQTFYVDAEEIFWCEVKLPLVK